MDYRTKYAVLRIVMLGIAVVATLSSGYQPANAERRVALVIGNSAYKHAAPLPNPRNDAKAIAAALRRLNFEVVAGIDLDARGMREKVKAFAKSVRRADVALLYYAGHGLQVEGENYLVPIDAKLATQIDLEYEATKLKLFLRFMDRQAKTNLIFLDACRNNPLSRNLAAAMGGLRSLSIGRGLARVESGIGTFIAYATQPGNFALDGSGRHSPFTEALLQHIETPGLAIASLMQRVRGAVLKQTKGRQVPWDHSSLTGDFFFKPPAPPPKTTPSKSANAKDDSSKSDALNEKAIELAVWNTIRHSKNPADFTAYLERFPDGEFAPWARIRLDSLKPKDRLTAERPKQPTKPDKPPPKPVTQTAALDPDRSKPAESSKSTGPPAPTQPIVAPTDRKKIDQAIVSHIIDAGSENCWGEIYFCILGEIENTTVRQVVGNQFTAVSRYTLLSSETLQGDEEKRAFESEFVLLKNRGKFQVVGVREIIRANSGDPDSAIQTTSE